MHSTRERVIRLLYFRNTLKSATSYCPQVQDIALRQIIRMLYGGKETAQVRKSMFLYFTDMYTTQ